MSLNSFYHLTFLKE